MRAFATFALAMFLSMLFAQGVALQLAIKFGMREELPPVMVIVGAFAVVSIALLTVAFIAGTGVAPIDMAAGVAVAVAVVPTLGLIVYIMSRNQWALPSAYDLLIATEVLISALVAVLIQWLLVRRYRKKHAGADDLS
jgi:hypothetical protein